MKIIHLIVTLEDLIEQWEGRHKEATELIERARVNKDKQGEARLIAKAGTIHAMTAELKREMKKINL